MAYTGKKKAQKYTTVKMLTGQNRLVGKECIFNCGTLQAKKGNKSDLEERVVEESAARQLAESLGIQYFETRAKSGKNVSQAVEALLDQIMEQMQSCVDRTTLPPGLVNGVERGHKLNEVDEAYEENKQNCAC